MIRPFIVPITIAVIAFGSGWFIKDKMAEAQISKINLTTAETLKDIAVTAATKQRELQNELDTEQAKWAAVETEQYTLLRDKEKQINQLRADVDAGRKRLRVNATCPASSDRLPETGTSSSVDNGATPRLTKDAEQAYFDLESGIDRITRQLLACQARVKPIPPETN
jgi:prophage endopeptidase